MKNIPLPPSSHRPQKYPGPSADAVLALRKQFMNPGLFLSCKKPLLLVEGSMQYLWDDTGKRHLDGLDGIVTISVGHCSSAKAACRSDHPFRAVDVHHAGRRGFLAGRF